MIKGTIAGIITATQLVINRGTRDGVRDSMRFAIYVDVGDIIDPDNPKNIVRGLRYKKGTIKINSVLDGMSIGSLEGSGLINYAGLTTLWSSSTYPGVEGRMLSEESFKIKVGDTVEELLATEPIPPAGAPSDKTESTNPG